MQGHMDILESHHAQELKGDTRPSERFNSIKGWTPSPTKVVVSTTLSFDCHIEYALSLLLT